jgi:hypothetical protein
MFSDSGNSFDKLSETNYTSWEGNMEGRLKRTQLWRIVTGARAAPVTTSPDYGAYCEKSDAAAGKIFGMLSEGQKVHVSGAIMVHVSGAISDDPKKMWEALKDVHQSTKPGVCFNTLNALFSLDLRDGESFVVSRTAKALTGVNQDCWR